MNFEGYWFSSRNTGQGVCIFKHNTNASIEGADTLTVWDDYNYRRRSECLFTKICRINRVDVMWNSYVDKK